MRKALIVSLLILLVAASIPQDAAAEVGVKGGLNFTTLNYSGPDAMWADVLCNSQGPIVGVFFSLGLGPVTIQPEAFYSRRGAKQELEGNDNIVYRLDYIEVPVLIKVNLIQGPISPVVFAGPFGAYNLSAKSITTIGGDSETVDIRDDHSKTDYGLVFGGGLEFKLQVIKLILEGRYTLGLQNYEPDSPEESFKNRGISILVGIGF